MKKANDTMRKFEEETRFTSWKSILFSLFVTICIIFLIIAYRSAISEHERLEEQSNDSTYSTSIKTTEIELFAPSKGEEIQLVKDGQSDTSVQQDIDISCKVQNSEIHEDFSEEKTDNLTDEISPVEDLVVDETIVTPSAPAAQNPFKQTKTYQFSDYEIELICQMVQHEVGFRASNFPGYDFDHIQQCMARVIINRVGTRGFRNSVVDVLIQPGQFVPSLDDVNSRYPTAERTLANVLKVVNNEDGLSTTLLFEMSYSSSVTPERALANMQSQVGKNVEAYSYAVTADGRYLLFGYRI